MKEFPHQVEVTKFIKGSPTPTISRDLFPSQDSKMVSHNPYSSSILVDIMTMSSQKVMVATRSTDYRYKGPIVNENDASPSSQTSTSIPSPTYEPL